ncbi:MAG: SufE family protein [Bacteroidetes bacterium]|nr:SufE family protein [Bacteroidota bacterium]
MNLNEVQKDIVEEFSIFEDWLDRYNYLIELGNDLPEIDPQYKSNEYLINGCQSKVWLHADLEDGKLVFNADSDAIIVKGIVALLVKVMNGRTPDEIVENKLFFIDEIGLSQNLSPTRSNGLLAMVKKMRLYAIAYQARSQQN